MTTYRPNQHSAMALITDANTISDLLQLQLADDDAETLSYYNALADDAIEELITFVQRETALIAASNNGRNAGLSQADVIAHLLDVLRQTAGVLRGVSYVSDLHTCPDFRTPCSDNVQPWSPLR